VRKRVASTVAILLALVAGHEISSRLELGLFADPFFTAGSAGKPVHLVYGDVEVTDVRPAKYVAPEISTELVKRAAGVFVMVSVEVTATREPTLFSAAYLVDEQGRQLRASNRSGCAISVRSPTGIPAYAVYCFDVPTDVLAGLRFHLGRGSLIYGTLQSDAVADIDLGISGADEKAWATTEDAVGAATSSDQPIELQTVTLTEQEPS